MEKKNKKLIKQNNVLIRILSKDSVRLLILFALLIFTVISGKFPYVNLIANHYFYGIGVAMVLALLFFKQYFNERRNKIILICEIAIAVVVKIMGNQQVEDIVGFILFVTLLLIVILGIASQRSKLALYLKK